MWTWTSSAPMRCVWLMKPTRLAAYGTKCSRMILNPWAASATRTKSVYTTPAFAPTALWPEATVEQLHQICKPPAFRVPDFAAWIAAAKKLLEKE